MVTVAFVVEGPSDKKLIESKIFCDWLRDECNLDLLKPVVDAGGNGNMCSRKIGEYVRASKLQTGAEKIVVLADLDPRRVHPASKNERKSLIRWA